MHTHIHTYVYLSVSLYLPTHAWKVRNNCEMTPETNTWFSLAYVNVST